MHKEADIREPLILADKTYKDITDDIIKPIESKAPKTWYLLFMIALVIALWWIPLGSFWSMAAIWIRYSSNIKKFFRFKK